MFSKYNEDLVADAVDNVIQNYERFPAIAVINRFLQELRRARGTAFVGGSVPAPVSRERVNMNVIHAAMAQIKSEKYQLNVSEKVQEFARRAFPDISEDRIKRNYCLLAHYAVNGCRLEGGSHVRLYMRKDGYIEDHVVVYRAVEQ